MFVKCTNTGITFIIECLRHSAKAILHSAKPLPNVTVGKEYSANILSAKVFEREIGSHLFLNDFGG
jgi:hypothetical protein